MAEVVAGAFRSVSDVILVDDGDRPVPADDLEETVSAAMAGVLSDRLEGVRQSLRRRPIEGDSDCAFRAVAVQDVRCGHDGHSRLRHAAVAYVEVRRNIFVGFSVKGTMNRR